MTTAATPRRSALALLLALAGCASTAYEPRDWSGYGGPGAEHFQAEEVPFPHVADPLEPINRVTAKVNYELLRWVVAPTASLYRFLVPEWVRTHLVNVGDNLQFPGRFVNNVLQGKLAESGVEASRFAINSTVGVLGLFDPAQDWGLHPYPEDFGQTFARWGWKPSNYLFLPFLGPHSLRDGVGKIPDALADPAFYLFPASYFRGFNSLSNHVEADIRAVESSYDAYEAGRTLYTLQREVDVDDFTWSEDDSGPTQTLRAIFLAPKDEDFGGSARTRKVRIDGARPEFPYSLWLQPKPAPICYVIPGFGGNRQGESTLALAELAFEHGHSVVAISSATNYEFMRRGATVSVPGYGPVDAHDVRSALAAIDRALEAELPGRLLERRLVGVSLGGYHALLIAAGVDRPAPGAKPAREEPELRLDLVLALNPPVSIEHALQQLDRFYNAPLSIPAEERDRRIEEIFAKVLYLSNGDLQPGTELPFTQLESRFLIGVAFRLDLQYMILQSQDLHDQGVLREPRSPLRMAPAFREASEYSYFEYIFAFVLPWYAERDPSIDDAESGVRRLFDTADLRTATERLADDPRVRVMTNENDFLLRPEDLTWLRSTLGDRLRLFDEGGHLGNLYGEYLQEIIGRAIDGEEESSSGAGDAREGRDGKDDERG